jgi:hypothetical protein
VAADRRCRPLAFTLTPGQAADSPQFVPVLAKVRVRGPIGRRASGAYPLTLNGGAAIGSGWVDDGALVLDGVDDYAATTGVPLDTGANYTVTAWAQAAAVPDGPATVQNQAFYSVADWNHVALAYDGFADQAQLYVNGRLEQVTCPDSDADGTADDTSCTDRVSWAANTAAFAATKSLQ